MRSKKVTFLSYLLIMAFVLSYRIVAQAQSPDETLKQYVTDLQKSLGDFALREKIIKHVRTMKPAPEIPEEARRNFVKGNTALQDVKDPADYDRAIARYSDALLIAPWWPDPYFNLAKASEFRQRYGEAIEALKLYLLAAPEAQDARAIQDMIYVLEEKKEKAKEKPAEAKPDFSGIWKEHDNPTCWTRKFIISGREITILNLCEERTEVYGTGTVDGRNFEGSSNSGYGIRYKGSLSEDNKMITFSYIRPQWSKWETSTWTRVQ